jgi:hypothetical protein
VTTQRALLQVLSSAHISGGIVETSSCASAKPDVPKHSFILAGLSVRQALDLIIEEDPKYEWIYDGKVINIVPVAGLPEILKTKIHHFHTQPGSLILDVGPLLFQTAEVKHVLSELGITEDDPLQVVFGSGDRRLAHEISLSETTVINALNVAATSYTKPAVWQYVEHRGKCKQTYYLSWPVL